MRNGRGWNRQAWVVALAGMLSLATACGDDEGGKGNDDPEDPNGEECPFPGRVEVDCICSDDQPPGSRECEDDHMWSACRCPQARPDDACDFEGQEYRCWLCPGEAERRIVRCREDLTFDCSCRRPDGGTARDGG